MKLSLGIVGLPNVGKSTLFKVLTRQDVNIANYPFATIDPNVGVVAVPDERLDQLASMSRSKKKIPAVVEFYDIAGLVKGANKGEGLGNQFLAHIRETQAVVIVLRIFENPEIIHVENYVDPLRDLETINTELALKDLETVEKRLHGVESDVKAGKKVAADEKDALLEIKNLLEEGRPIVSDAKQHTNILENVGVSSLNLLTAKKQIYLLNGVEGDVPPGLIEKIKSMRGDFIVANLAEPSLETINILIKKAYEVLGLISFFTTGEDETRAWTIERGTRAPQAAGVIHSDFEKNFIRAEVISYGKLMEAGSPSTHSTAVQGRPEGFERATGSGQSPWAIAKQKGWIRLEGKEYVVEDGDVLVVRHG